jgi:hypothetical protein
MKETSLLNKVLWHQALGFLTIIFISWLVEFTGLRALVFGTHPYLADYRESAFEMLFVLVVWLFVANSTRRILRHIRYLQGFMRVCAWCRHIHYKGDWIRLEEFMQQGFDTPTTHGICPGCLRKQKEALQRAKRSAALAAAAQATAAPTPNTPTTPG